jgi:predicted dehydrogenase
MAVMSDDTIDKIPVAVIGAGRMGRHHARIYHQLPEAKLLAVVDPDEDRAGALADQYGCDCLASVKELLEKYPQVRAVSLATPTVHHAPVAQSLLEHRVACLIEKPLAQSVAEARRIVELADQYGTLVQVGHSERFNPIVRRLAELEIRPRFIEVDRVSPMTFRSIDVGVVFDIMIHDLDIVLMLSRSELVDVRAVGVAVLGKHEDVASARLQFADGCVANLTASRLALKTERKLRLFSETAYVSLDYARKTGVITTRTANAAALEEVRQQIAAGADLSDLDYTQIVNRQELEINDEEPLRGELSNFLAAVAGRARPEVDARAGYAAVDAAQRVVEAIASHRWEGVDLLKPVM